VPLVWDDRVLGELALDLGTTAKRNLEDVSFMVTIAQQCAQAVERLRLVESQDRTQRRLRYLADASEMLASSLDYRTTVANVVDRTVPAVADWCAVHLVEDDGSVQLLVCAARDRLMAAAYDALWQREQAGTPLPSALEEVLATGQPAFHPNDRDVLRNVLARDDEERDLLRAMGVSSGVIAPLTTQSRRLGTIAIGLAGETRTVDLDDLALVEDIGRRLAAAIDTSRLYTERSEVARKLQLALLPPSLPQPPGFDCAVCYRAAGAGNEVGGDFYDLFELSDGSWVLVVGDVCGKGPEAAAITGLARHTVRAVAMHEHDPARILDGLNAALLSQRSDRFCTVCVARLEVTDSGARMTVATAGHPLPVVVTADRQDTVAGCAGMPAGLFADLDATDLVVDLARGDMVVLYTDGVTERHEGERAFGEEGLYEILKGQAGTPAQEVVKAVEAAVVGFDESALRDDMAVLVMRVLP
jgi:serine phosphatase RsbU (regulator of sigma subunit)